MISLRHHVISLAAVFLALAVGVVLGSSTLSNGLLSGLSSDKSELQDQVHALQGQVNNQQQQLNSADIFDSAISGRVVHDALAQHSVVIFTAPDARRPDVDAVAKTIEAAGGSVAGRVGLTDSFVSLTGADKLRSTIANVIPAGVQLSTAAVDPGSLAGDLLGSVLLLNPQNNQTQSTPQERDLAMQTLRSGGFIAYDDGAVKPAQLALVITGGAAKGGDGNTGATVARFAAGLDGRGGGTVLAGATGSADGNAAVAMARSDAAISSKVSTVDDVDHSSGQITTVLALQQQLDNKAGKYGTGVGAEAVTVGS
ncbi:copper transporter [Rhodococcus sp. D2-41]|uniref:copper transporter n=1 Tax=Speluncibacter jeojiensis TaxID=2710754 RepID=UPI002410AD59|nr:copper transporter [Rhodococcus sp. D2-41]MDG3012879.1 copper transporter [Rhodococcus sp. D2-41]